MTSKPPAQSNQGEEVLEDEIVYRLARLETKVEDMEKMLQDISDRLDKLDKKIMLMSSNHVSVKWFTYLLIILLSFVAAMFGLGWRPPH